MDRIEKIGFEEAKEGVWVLYRDGRKYTIRRMKDTYTLVIRENLDGVRYTQTYSNIANEGLLERIILIVRMDERRQKEDKL